MKHIQLLILCVMMFYNAMARDVITLQTGWKFSKGAQPLAFKQGFDDSKWKVVSVPHDWAIEGPVITDGDGNTGKLPWKGEGWYRLEKDIPDSYRGKVIYLVFDGVMAFPEVFVNGNLAGKWDYGYSSFYLDITKLIQPGKKNLFAVHADTRNHDSRWYPGAGIYRKVRMIVVNPVHTGIWGTCITTPVIKEDRAEIKVVTTVCNRSGKIANIRLQNNITSPDGENSGPESTDTEVPADSTKEIALTFSVHNPRLWDVDHPFLYQVKTLIYASGSICDSCSSSFGIRSIQFTADNGFYLNGRRVQIRGVNLHHDQGPLGAAFHVRAMERELEIMKSMGCNAIRTSHNVPAPEVLDLCDKMGILVFAEAFDKYDGKADITPETDFNDFARKNIRNFVVRDRNHPSIIIWSAGNEMGDEQNNRNNGFARLGTMFRYIRQSDPTRPVTMACDDQQSAALRHFDLYDVHSWNYGCRYHLARTLEPLKSVIISESSSTVSTRGFYEWPLPENKTDFTASLQVSSYDLNAPAWAELSDDDFMWQQNEKYVAGEFVWTGFDYLGEPTPYGNDWTREHGLGDEKASRSSYFGIVDLCGIPKDRYYLYKSYWNPDSTTVHILPHWNWKDKTGEKIPVFVYTNGDSAELFLNGKSLGMRRKIADSQKSVERFRLMWMDVVYTPGELKAVAYKNGNVIGGSRVKTTGEPVALKLTADRRIIKADGEDLSYVLIEAIDKDGNPCPMADNSVHLALTGSGIIAGVGNGNPQSTEPFQGNDIRLFYGKAMVIIGSGDKKGDTNLSVSASGLAGENVRLTIN